MNSNAYDIALYILTGGVQGKSGNLDPTSLMPNAGVKVLNTANATLAAQTTLVRCANNPSDPDKDAIMLMRVPTSVAGPATSMFIGTNAAPNAVQLPITAAGCGFFPMQLTGGVGYGSSQAITNSYDRGVAITSHITVRSTIVDGNGSDLKGDIAAVSLGTNPAQAQITPPGLYGYTDGDKGSFVRTKVDAEIDCVLCGHTLPRYFSGRALYPDSQTGITTVTVTPDISAITTTGAVLFTASSLTQFNTAPVDVAISIPMRLNSSATASGLVTVYIYADWGAVDDAGVLQFTSVVVRQIDFNISPGVVAGALAATTQSHGVNATVSMLPPVSTFPQFFIGAWYKIVPPAGVGVSSNNGVTSQIRSYNFDVNTNQDAFYALITGFTGPILVERQTCYRVVPNQATVALVQQLLDDAAPTDTRNAIMALTRGVMGRSLGLVGTRADFERYTAALMRTPRAVLAMAQPQFRGSLAGVAAGGEGDLSDEKVAEYAEELPELSASSRTLRQFLKTAASAEKIARSVGRFGRAAGSAAVTVAPLLMASARYSGMLTNGAPNSYSSSTRSDEEVQRQLDLIAMSSDPCPLISARSDRHSIITRRIKRARPATEFLGDAQINQLASLGVQYLPKASASGRSGERGFYDVLADSMEEQLRDDPDSGDEADELDVLQGPATVRPPVEDPTPGILWKEQDSAKATFRELCREERVSIRLAIELGALDVSNYGFDYFGSVNGTLPALCNPLTPESLTRAEVWGNTSRFIMVNEEKNGAFVGTLIVSFEKIFDVETIIDAGGWKVHLSAEFSGAPDQVAMLEGLFALFPPQSHREIYVSIHDDILIRHGGLVGDSWGLALAAALMGLPCGPVLSGSFSVRDQLIQPVGDAVFKLNSFLSGTGGEDVFFMPMPKNSADVILRDSRSEAAKALLAGRLASSTSQYPEVIRGYYPVESLAELRAAYAFGALRHSIRELRGSTSFPLLKATAARERQFAAMVGPIDMMGKTRVALASATAENAPALIRQIEVKIEALAGANPKKAEVLTNALNALIAVLEINDPTKPAPPPKPVAQLKAKAVTAVGASAYADAMAQFLKDKTTEKERRNQMAGRLVAGPDGSPYTGAITYKNRHLFDHVVKTYVVGKGEGETEVVNHLVIPKYLPAATPSLKGKSKSRNQSMYDQLFDDSPG